MKNKLKIVPLSIIAAVSAAILWAMLLPLHRPWQFALCFAFAVLAGKGAAYLKRRKDGRKNTARPEVSHTAPPSSAAEEPVSPDLLWIRTEGGRALTELGRLYASIPDENVKQRIMELTDLASKIIKDAEADPRDIPRIKNFLNVRLPETVMLLNKYDRMYSSGASGAADIGSGKDIDDALDEMSRDFAARFDSLFDQELLDIETDISAMESTLKSDGLSASDFKI